MTKSPSSFQRNLILICFFALLRSYDARNFFDNLDLSTQTLIPTITGFGITGTTGNDYVGARISTAGDINKDGYADIIIGVNNRNSLQGIVYVIYGGEESSFLNIDLSTTTLIPTSTGFTITGQSTGDQLGVSVSAAGDVNNDGYDDIIIGAQAKDSNRGAAYVIYGGPKSAMTNIILGSTALSPTSTGFIITGNLAGDYFGCSVSGAGDINNDGYDDIVVGAYGKTSFRGVAYVIYGGDKSTRTNIALTTNLSPTSTGFMITGQAVGDYFGLAVSAAGNVDNDDYDDIMISANYKNNYQGTVYVIYGGDKSTRTNIVLTTALSPASTGFTITGQSTGDNLGNRVSTAGDINNDGYDDIIVGANQRNGYQGAVYVIYGGDKSTRSNIALSPTALTPASTGFWITGNAASDYFGSSLDAAGDINKDGYDDIIVGAGPGNKAYVIYGGAKSSRSNIVLSSTTLDPTSTGFTLTGNAAGDSFGSVSTAGDFNNDGYVDILVGAPLKDSTKGVAYMIYASCSQYCKQCSSESVCTQCKNTYLMYQSKCFATCPDTTRPASTTCENCPNYCKHCSSASICTECSSSYLMYQSQCFGFCPDGTFANTATTCADCSDHCNHCTSNSVCTECKTSFLMYQSKCFATCPDTTFASTTTTCQDCSAHCNHCSSTSVCTECISPSLLYKSQCLDSCPEATIATSTTCEDCSDHCNECTSTTVCTKCYSPYILYQDKCLDSCPDGMFLSTATNTCEYCISPCNKCTSLTSCTECLSPLILYSSGCLVSCPKAMFNSNNVCKDCPSGCSSCTSRNSCQTCFEGFILSDSLCASDSSQQAKEKATKAISSATQAIGSVVCVGSAAFPFSMLVSKIVQNTRYLNLSVTNDLAGVYKTWQTDIISWDVPNVMSNLDHFETSPPLFAQYDIDSPFLVNFWPTLINVGIGFGTFIVCIFLQKILEHEKYEGWVYSLVRKLVAGSFNFALIQAYACLDDILFYLVIDAKTNPFNSFFSWTSIVCAVLFLAIGCFQVYFNFWTVYKLQSIKSQGNKEIEAFNEKNKYWELFYSDFNDDDLWSQSFFAVAIIRSVLSSSIIAVLYDYPLMQASYLVTLDIGILSFLYLKNPFNTLRGTLAQYYYEIITLLVHLCAFILGLQDTFKTSSETVTLIMSTGILYLNTALVSGAIGFMFIEIYKTISEKKRAARLKQPKNILEDPQETQNLQSRQITPEKRPYSINREQTFSIENFHLEPEYNHQTSDLNMESSQGFESKFYVENSLEMNPSKRINYQRDQSPTPIMIRSRHKALNQSQQRENPRNPSYRINYD